MPEVSRLVIPASLDHVRDACDAVVQAAEATGLDERDVYHCQMAVDEALTNIIEHGYSLAGDDHEIEIVSATEPGKFLITIIDDSPAFNPLEHEAPDPSEPLDSREPGGWGIYFIRRLMDDVQYQRVDNKNRLTLVKHHAAPVHSGLFQGEPSAYPVRTLDDRVAVISPAGRLDSNSSTLLEQTLSTLLEKDFVWLVVDMADVDYIASSGLKVLVAAWRRARENSGDVVLSNLQPRIVEIFEMVGFDMLFQVFQDLDAAVAARSQ